jgi:organic radical activating enzyme
MALNLAEMPFLTGVGLVVTYRCQVECSHCILNAGPRRTEEMSLSDAFDWIEQIASYRNGQIGVLSLTGGEPFYDIEKLKEISTFARSHGLLVSAVTNAFWASTPERAMSLLKELPAIRILDISADVYHQQHIPFCRVRNAVLASKKTGIPFNVVLSTEDEGEPEYREILAKVYEIAPSGNVLTSVTLPVGRARMECTLKHQMTREPPAGACSLGSTPIIFPNGDVSACCGPLIDLPRSHPLALGNLHENSLEEILERAESNVILHTIRIWGPKRLISIMRDAGMGRDLPRLYIKDSVCGACYDLMSNGKVIEFLDHDVQVPSSLSTLHPGGRPTEDGGDEARRCLRLD